MLRLKYQIGQQDFILALVYLASVNSIGPVRHGLLTRNRHMALPCLAQQISPKRVAVVALQRTIDASHSEYSLGNAAPCANSRKQFSATEKVYCSPQTFRGLKVTWFEFVVNQRRKLMTLRHRRGQRPHLLDRGNTAPAKAHISFKPAFRFFCTVSSPATA